MIDLTIKHNDTSNEYTLKVTRSNYSGVETIEPGAELSLTILVGQQIIIEEGCLASRLLVIGPGGNVRGDESDLI